MSNIDNKRTITNYGDIWICGKHRVICGDSSDTEIVKRLADTYTVDLIITSPPYGNRRAYTTGGISNWDKLMQGVFYSSFNILKNETQIFINLGLIAEKGCIQQYWLDWLNWMSINEWRFFGWYVWDKLSVMPGDHHGRLAPRHEFIFHFNKVKRTPNKIIKCTHGGKLRHKKDEVGKTFLRFDGTAPNWVHGGVPIQEYRIPDSVIAINKENMPTKGHPAVFPVKLPAFILEAYTNVEDVVLDPFGGSGSTLIACEQLNRICLISELAPMYVDIIIKRWQDFTKQEAINAETGVKFNVV